MIYCIYLYHLSHTIDINFINILIHLFIPNMRILIITNDISTIINSVFLREPIRHTTIS